MQIDTPLLVVGRGPAAVVVAKIVAGYGVPCLLAGHEVLGDDTPVALSPDATAELERHGLVDILRPYLDAPDPLTITPREFEEVIKHHCVADLNVVVYDEVAVVDRVDGPAGFRGVLTDGTSTWELAADVFVDADLLPRDLSDAITAGAAAARRAVESHRSAPAG
jgi:hypothetical protein